MTQDEISQQERFGRVIAFADSDEHKADFPANKPSGANVAILRDVRQKLNELGGSQTGSAGAGRAATGRKNALLDSVRADLVGLAKTARAVEDEQPGLAHDFRLPTTGRDEDLLSAARNQLALLKTPASGAALVALFVDYGMPDNFVDDLEADIAAVDEADAQQDAHGSDRREDTLAIDAQIDKGIKAVAKLDAYCDNKYRDNAVSLGAWKSASHLELRRVHPKPKPPAG